MADVTSSQLADTIGIPIDRLLQQLQEAGLPQRKPEDDVSEDEKQTLLGHIKKAHGENDSAPRKSTLKRRTLSKLKTPGGGGRGRTVNVEVRKKRTYVRKVESEPAEVSENPVVSAVPVAPEIIDEETRRRAAHAEIEEEAEKCRQESAQKVAEEQALRLAEAKAAEATKAKEEEAKKEVADEKATQAKEQIKGKIVQIEKAKKVVRNLENEYSALLEEIGE